MRTTTSRISRRADLSRADFGPADPALILLC
jgi:hypothetical protein